LRRLHSSGRRAGQLRRRENRWPERQLRPRLRCHQQHKDSRRGQLPRRRLLRRHRRPRRARRHRTARWTVLERTSRPARLDDGEPEPSQQRPPLAGVQPQHAHRQ
ncbi:hypothetical protein ACJX0J_025269, partial [Zea mays]